MSEQNKAVARRFYEELFVKRNLNALDEIFAPNIIDHSPMPGQAPGVAGIKEMFGMYLEAFPDAAVNVEEIIAERDLVVARFSATATHNGEMMGAAPTGKRVTFEGIDMLRIRGDKVTEVWHQGNEMLVMMQLGIKPPV